MECLRNYELSEEFGIVYIFKHRESGLTKIGITNKNVHTRLNTLERQSGNTIEEYAISVPMRNGLEKIVEKILHNKFSRKRKRGEYFDITFSDAVAELNRITESNDFKKRNVEKSA